ncbi:CxxxxCH/CxxCH domain-containing protein [Geobacter sp.]|uniref:CxxxxCH/CxxCH domain c-type cytochrome n=1 Tax=Geobacter sp. TaxID=46610 RepID=UPI00261DAC0C|nr:CxxxxCH/CxxCH domain-containing protein [Geobacter sp.]
MESVGRRWRRMAPWLVMIFMLVPQGASEAAIQCYDCHGSRSPVDYRPVDAPFRNVSSGGMVGSHRTHMEAAATPSACARCHPGSSSYTPSHRDGKIKLSANINTSPLAATYRNQSSAFLQTPNSSPGTCSNVNCHFEAETPAWGTAPLAAPGGCATCHGAAPNDGNHPAASGPGKKHGDYLGTGTGSCGFCHTDHTTEPAPFGHATTAGRRSLTVRFTKAPNSGGTYSGTVTYPSYLPSQSTTRNGTCSDLYCHSDGRGGAPFITALWSDSGTMKCYSCHRGQTSDSTEANCTSVGGVWDSGKSKCTPYLNMSSNGHNKLVGSHWIRKYPCYYCHSATTDAAGNIIDTTKHVNGTKDVKMAPQWNIVGRDEASYDPATKVCSNVYCHSDGTTDPETVRAFPWTASKAGCNDCHGHPRGACSNTGCHDGRMENGKEWTLPARFGTLGSYAFPPGQEWMEAMPMFANQGAGTPRANSHPRHSETNFTCDNCHAATVIGDCASCHNSSIPSGSMGESSHLNGAYHVNKTKDVVFRDGGTYNPVSKTCSNTKCHTGGTDPVWGGSVSSAVTCLGCHGTSGADVDDYGGFNNGVRAKINMTQWYTAGHGRYSSSGRYPASGNPAANFPGNPCWYCHDNNVLHNYTSNRFRLRRHPQFERRFDKECVYCHMEGKDYECRGCHNAAESLAPQLANITSAQRFTRNHGPYAGDSTSCVASCHTDDATIHKTGSTRFWTPAEKDDVKNQYVMMGVCLQCHDDDSGGQCTSCHTPPADNPDKYSLGFDPKMEGTRLIKPKQARASASHFGYKHFRAYEQSGVWKGGKFCWNCHDPHGDSNIYMIHDKVATTTDGRQGVPQSLAPVVFTQKVSGSDYVRIKDPQNPDLPINGICNVCHSTNSRHYTKDGGDSHNLGRVCTGCHEHRFADSHANKQACDSCHTNKKPVPKHTAFGLPRDCTKCHSGSIGKRMDVMGQMKANSHHVQGVDVNNRHCYACHWEATPEGLINRQYHEGYDYKNYTSVKNAKVDLVVWKPGLRPMFYNTTTAVQFLAANVGTGDERAEVNKVTNHCLGCHSDQNNDTRPFDDCKTPRQYAWDRQSIAARYSQTGTTSWGKYNSATYPNANKKDTVTKAFSAHGNAVANKGGWSAATGYDAAIPITRGNAGTQNVQCFDCHNSHGSKAVGTTSGYVTFNGTRNGANLKETQKGKGGYNVTYKAVANSTGTNPYNTGAAQCFDCHETATGGVTTPWGYSSTFGATAPVMGYMDTSRFGQTTKGGTARHAERDGRKTIVGGHLKAQKFLNYSATGTIGGLCTPCHDPHGVSPTLGSNQPYGVPLLKGTWLSSPYQDDGAQPRLGTSIYATPTWKSDRNTLSTDVNNNSNRIRENDSQFAGLCLNCHRKEKLTDGVNKNTAFKTLDRVHESVQGWGANNEHSYPCSKCHQPHVSGLPRLLQTNCMDVNHRGGQMSGGIANRSGWRCGNWTGFPRGTWTGLSCHNGNSTDQRWNDVSPW